MQFPYSWRFLFDLQMYCILERIFSFNGLPIHEGSWINLRGVSGIQTHAYYEKRKM